MVSKKKSISEKYSILLKIVGFSVLTIAGYIDLVNSNNTILTENTYNTSCISKNDGTSYKWYGCGDNQHDYCSRFKLFITIIIVFIHIHFILF